MQPIEVRAPGKSSRVYTLVAGAHWLAAVRSLGRTEIDAVVLAVDDIEARLREIDENLFRRELSALDRAVFLLKRQELYEAQYPEAVGRAASARTENNHAEVAIGKFSLFQVFFPESPSAVNRAR